MSGSSAACVAFFGLFGKELALAAMVSASAFVLLVIVMDFFGLSSASEEMTEKSQLRDRPDPRRLDCAA
jgi:hypothetical protein